MTLLVDISRLTPIANLAGEDADETRELQAMAKAASDYLSEFRWCGAVRNVYAGIAVAGVIGVFFAQIQPTQPEVDEWLWVVVGDVPPAYIVTDDAHTSVAALDAYAREMEAWVEAVDAGQPVDELIPVNAPATREYATMLRSRLDLLRQRVLPAYSDG